MRLTAGSLFFPAAALHAAIVLPVSVLGMTGTLTLATPLATLAGHAQAMLLGFGLAVIAGFQLPALSRARLLLLFALWLGARAMQLSGVTSALAFALDGAFALLLALHVVPRLVRAAKKWRNQALPALLGAASVAALGYVLAMLGVRVGASAAALRTAMVIALAGLMLFMGGRIIAPAMAGAFYRQGRSLDARVQPRIEAALIMAIAVALAAAVLALDMPLRLACGLAACLALVRLVRWQPWRALARHDLLRLCAGYLWLAVGLVAVAASGPGGMRVAAYHVILVGALGTLTLNVMANVTAARSHAPAGHAALVDVATALVATAAVLRFVASLDVAWTRTLLGVAAGCWSAAFALLAWLLVRSLRTRRRAEHA